MFILILFVRYWVRFIIIILCLEVVLSWVSNLGFCGVLLILKVSRIIVFMGCNRVLWIILWEMLGYMVIILIGCGVIGLILNLLFGFLFILMLVFNLILMFVFNRGGRFGELKVLKLLVCDFWLWLLCIKWLLKNRVILLIG